MMQTPPLGRMQTGVGNMATSPDVETLERDTAEARARLANTLDKLTSPATADAVKQELTDYAQGLKDQAFGYVQETKDSVLNTGRDKATGFADDLKQRALANPLGIALIGAGIGWHLYKKPPITTLLIGAGIATLMKGGSGSPRLDASGYRDPYDPAQPRGYVPGGVAGYGYPVHEGPPGSSMSEKASAAASHAGDIAQDLGVKAREIASDATERASAAVETARTSVTSAAETARTVASQAADTARTAVLEAAETARTIVSEAAANTRKGASDMVQLTTSTITQTADQTMRRASGLARQAQGNPLVLGALGLAVGTAIVYLLRSNETEYRSPTGTRFTPDRSGRGNPGMRSEPGHAVRRNVSSASGSAGSSAGGSVSNMASAASDGLNDVAGRASDIAGRASDVASDLASSAAETVSGVASAASRIIGAAGGTVASSASGAYRSAADLASSAGRRAPVAADRVQQQISELGERYPLLLGAVSLAIGAAVGGSLRLSEQENRLMGPLSGKFKQRAMEMANEQFVVAREAAQHFAGDLGAQLGSSPSRDQSADFETVIGGGKPAVTGASGNGQGAARS